ncbi:MAG TPA: nicotinate phosphoribosyltransferase [Terriglobia bacterium]|jgi:nicotinate phosphoribosyltransferase|nr:nicotinate phosphoribosyltransferase [Terriglobia bacterium]
MDATDTNRALLVDLYELTMAAAYFEHRIDCRATFELFVRQMPPTRSYLVAAGVEAALNYLENLHFTDENIRYLRSLPAFRTVSDSFFEYLGKLRFTGEVRGVEEGTLVFADEPILQVSGPVLEAQIVETYLLSVVNFETLVASKAARVVQAAGDRGVLEFGTRRAHGPEAGVRAGRAAYLGGCVATSNVLAGALYGVPLAGTAAHSWTQVFPTERASFEALLETFPESAILLIDTYNPIEGAETAAGLKRKVPGVRLDSGNLLEKSRQVREILDRQGLHEAKIVASGDLNEYRIEELVSRGAPIDLFGVGTDLATSRDVPALSVVYKLVETERGGHVEPKTKLSEEKVYYPGRKQVFRYSINGQYHHDLVARANEYWPDAEPLLRPLMKEGRRLDSPVPLGELRSRTLRNLRRLPNEYKALRSAPAYPVLKSEALERLLESVRTGCLRAATPSAASRTS